MTQMTTGAARVVDPVLSTVARGYRNQNYVGSALFPYVPVGARGGKIITFDKSAWRQYNLARAPGSAIKRINVGFSGAPFALAQHALEGQLPIEIEEEANVVPGIDMASTTVMTTQDIIDLRLEIAQATLATTAANYGASNKVTLSGTSQWSDYTNSDPIGDVDTAIEAIRATTGMRPNIMVIGPKVWKILKRHPKLVDAAILQGVINIGGGAATPRLTKAQMAQIFDVEEFYVGDAIALDASDANTDVWGKNVTIAYTRIATLAARGTPSYGYTYRLRNYPMVEQPYYEKNTRSWIYPIIDEVAPVIAGAEAGYLISAAVA
jgi:hypothetical protein